MVDFVPPLAFVPSPVFVPPPVPIAPPAGVPGIGPMAPPVLPPLEVPVNPFAPVPFEPSGIPPLPLPGNLGEARALFRESGVPSLPLPADLFQPGPEVAEFLPPPFEGGQCPIRYRYTARATAPTGTSQGNCVGSQSFTSTGALWGPILSGPMPVQEVCSGGPGRGASQWAVLCFGAGGAARQETARLVNVQSIAYTFSFASLTPDPVAPDNCGSLPPVREEERAQNPARAFQPNRIQPFRRPRPRPDVLPEVNPAPQQPPLPAPPPAPDPDPARRPDRRVPGPPLPIGPVTPPEVVPFTPGTIPDLPTFPQVTPVRVPSPPRFPQLPPLLVPAPPVVPVRRPQFPPLPRETPTRQTPPVIVAPPPPVRIPPPVRNDCCAVPEVIRQGASIIRAINQIRDRGTEDCVDLCEPAVMLDIECTGGLGLPIQTREQAVTVLTLSAALGRLSRQVFEIAQYLNICNPFPDEPVSGPGACGPGEVGPVVYAGNPPQNGVDVSFGDPPEGRAWVGAIARCVASPGVGAIPSLVAPNAAYTQVVGNVSLSYGGVRGEAHQVRSEWNEVIRPVGAPYATGVYVAAIPQTFVTIFPVSVTIPE